MITNQINGQQVNYHQVAPVTSWNNLLMFAGGDPQKGMNKSNRIDIYDISTRRWSLKYLSQGRELLAAVTLNNITMFAGGDGYGGESDIVDVWNHTTDTWSIMHLYHSLGRD